MCGDGGLVPGFPHGGDAGEEDLRVAVEAGLEKHGHGAGGDFQRNACQE